MKLRHAAALALVGWYLMLPPDTSDKLYPPPYSSIPLQKWSIIESYDTAAACEAGYRKYLADYNKYPQIPHDYNSDYQRWNASKCISTDDPRLKPN
jgi:hypothetical protein